MNVINAAGLLVSLVAVCGAVVLSDGCKREPKLGPVNTGLPTTTMQLGNERFTLEIAADEKSREFGLMNRPSMPADRGMIFVFPREDRRSFYMRNTLIPLDIVYVGADQRVVSIHPMRPHDLTSVPSLGPAKYAIELNQGASARAGIKPGDQLQIPREAAHTDR